MLLMITPKQNKKARMAVRTSEFKKTTNHNIKFRLKVHFTTIDGGRTDNTNGLSIKKGGSIDEK